jgi:hypothetical protein
VEGLERVHDHCCNLAAPQLQHRERRFGLSHTVEEHPSPRTTPNRNAGPTHDHAPLRMAKLQRSTAKRGDCSQQHTLGGPSMVPPVGPQTSSPTTCQASARESKSKARGQKTLKSEGTNQVHQSDDVICDSLVAGGGLDTIPPDHAVGRGRKHVRSSHIERQP